VVKRMKNASLPAFQQEVALMWLFQSHACMVKLIGYDEQRMDIVMPEYNLGSLEYYINTRSYKSKIARSIATDVARGIQAMHQKGIVHQDIKGKYSH
jgi:serine/threonine protein kinase